MNDRDKVIDVSEEFQRLHNAWMIHIYEHENSANVHLHAPPAVVLAASKIFESSMVDDDESFDVSDWDTPCMTTPRDIIEYGTKLFEFGQRTAMAGIFAANMTPCRCTEITDEDIAKLMGDKHD